jgi:uncharacterized protein with NRDE domain
MCLLLLAFHAHRDRPWLLLGNRDEFHARATAAAEAWATRRKSSAVGTWRLAAPGWR